MISALLPLVIERGTDPVLIGIAVICGFFSHRWIEAVPAAAGGAVIAECVLVFLGSPAAFVTLPFAAGGIAALAWALPAHALRRLLFGGVPAPATRHPPNPDDYPDTPFRSFETFLAGVKHRGEDGQDAILACEPGLDLWVIRDADNPHDPNAMAVWSPSGDRLGYIPAELAAGIAPLIDAGAVAAGRVIEQRPPSEDFDFWNLRILVRLYRD